MAKECCVNRLLHNTLTGNPPNIDPPSEGFDWYIYELIVDTQGFGASNAIVSINIDGVSYDNTDDPGIGGQVSDGARIGVSLITAFAFAGLTDYSDAGGYGFNDHASFNLSYGFMVADSLHDISITWDSNLGQPHETAPFVVRGVNNPVVNSCASIAGDPATQIIMGYRVTAPINTGGTQTIQLDTLNFSTTMDLDIVQNDLYLSLLSLINGMVDPFAGTQPMSSTSVVDGGNYDFTLFNNFGVITEIVTDQATVPLTSC